MMIGNTTTKSSPDEAKYRKFTSTLATIVQTFCEDRIRLPKFWAIDTVSIGSPFYRARASRPLIDTTKNGH